MAKTLDDNETIVALANLMNPHDNARSPYERWTEYKVRRKQSNEAIKIYLRGHFPEQLRWPINGVWDPLPRKRSFRKEK